MSAPKKHRRKIDVIDPAEFLSWIKAAAVGYCRENGRQGPNGIVEVNLDNMLKGVATEAVHLLGVISQRAPDELESRLDTFFTFVAVNLGCTYERIAEEEPPADRGRLN